MSKKTFTTAFNRTESGIRDVGTMKFTEPSKVKESLSYATDINVIYDNYCKTGRLPLNGQKPIYDENFVSYDSLVESQKIVAECSEYFNGLPASIKNQYGNSLNKFVAALNNKDEFLVKNGVLVLPSEKNDASQSLTSDLNQSSNDIIPPVSEGSTNESVNTATTD